MRELHLVHPVGKDRLSVFKWVDGKQTWERQASGDYVISLTDSVRTEEFTLPQTSVRYERRVRAKAEAKK